MVTPRLCCHCSGCVSKKKTLPWASEWRGRALMFFFFNRASRKIGELLYVSDIAHNIFLVVPVAEILFHLACKDLRETW